jgi:hypothetical protein
MSTQYEPALVEAAVLAAVRARPAADRFARERDPLYEIEDAEARDAAFAGHHTRWFEALGLGRPLLTALAETPAVEEGCARCVVTRARDPRDEWVELMVPPGAGRAVVLVVIGAETLAVPARALALLRRELLHAADMLDPAFGYRPRLPGEDAASPLDRALRERYRVLWNASVDGRLARAGRGEPGAEPERRRQVLRTFPDLAGRAAAVFEAVWSGAIRTHAGLLAIAAGESRGGARCPLCRFPSAASARADLPPAVSAAIAADFPAWDPRLGACARCAELYAAREPGRTSSEFTGPRFQEVGNESTAPCPWHCSGLGPLVLDGAAGVRDSPSLHRRRQGPHG